jgi:tRNA(Ile)-lysidine synthase
VRVNAAERRVYLKMGGGERGGTLYLLEELRFYLPMVCGRSEKMLTRNPLERRCPLEIRVLGTLQKYNMLARGEHVVVAVSGGADSTALLLCLHNLSRHLAITITVAHLNHRIRGREGDEDEEFVRRMSADMKLQYVSEAIEIKREAAATKQNIEELARRMRYDFLFRAAGRVGAQKIAVGHNMNDQVETALFRFMRGSGLEGLSGIHPVVDGRIIRPLLECSRESIFEYLKEHKAPYKEDSTNEDLRYARNRIRHELLPYLESKFNPRLIPTIAHEALLLREIWSFVESRAKESLARLRCPIENGISIKIKEFLDLEQALQREVLRQALKECMGSLRGIGYVHIESILSLCSKKRSGARIQLPHGGLAVRLPETLLLLRHKFSDKPIFSYHLSVPGSCRVIEDGAVFHCTVGVAPNRDAMKDRRFRQAFLEPSVLPQSLTIRSRAPGDRYGGSGHRKVKKMLINSKIPRSQRSSLPMVAAGNDIIWIPGFRPARGYEAQPESLNCIVIERIKDSG